MNSRRIIIISLIGLGLIAAWAAAKQAPTPPRRGGVYRSIPDYWGSPALRRGRRLSQRPAA